MRITYKPQKTAYLRSIVAGECFKHQETLYMKSSSSNGDSGCTTCISLETGKLFILDDMLEVIPFYGRITENEDM